MGHGFSGVRRLPTAKEYGGRRGANARSQSPALGLVLPDDALVPVDLVLDSVLKYATGLGELSNNLVATFSFAISADTGRKVQSLPNRKFMRRHVPLQNAECRRLRRHSALLNAIRFGG
jgi:hypothetical protein